MNDPKLQAAFEQMAHNVNVLGLLFLFGGDEGYRQASAIMEKNRRQAESSRSR